MCKIHPPRISDTVPMYVFCYRSCWYILAYVVLLNILLVAHIQLHKKLERKCINPNVYGAVILHKNQIHKDKRSMFQKMLGPYIHCAEFYTSYECCHFMT